MKPNRRLKKIKAPKYWKNLERHPASSAYLDVSAQLAVAMVAGVKNYGVIDRQIVLVEHEGRLKVLEGWQLYKACIAAGHKPEFAGLPDGLTAEGYVELKNDLRRHESPEQAQARIDARRERVREAREVDNKSNRRIAKDEGISESQVRKDLKPPSAHQCAPDPLKTLEEQEGNPSERAENTEIYQSQDATGRNGGSYLAQRTSLRCERCVRLNKNDPNCPQCRSRRGPKTSGSSQTIQSGTLSASDESASGSTPPTIEHCLQALNEVICEMGNALGDGEIPKGDAFFKKLQKATSAQSFQDRCLALVELTGQEINEWKKRVENVPEATDPGSLKQ